MSHRDSRAVIHPLAQLGDDAEVGPWCYVEDGVVIGAGTRLLQHVVVLRGTTLGDANQVHAFTVIGGVPQTLGAASPGHLMVGHRNVIREHVTINLGSSRGGGETAMGDDNLVMAQCHLAHDVRIGSRCVVASGTRLAGHVQLDDFAWIGGNVSVAQWVRIGTHAFVGGHAAIDRDVPPFCVAYGNRPAIIRGCNIVGLRRRGFDRAAIAAARDLVKTWTDPTLQKQEAVRKIEDQYGSEHPLAQVFLLFVKHSRVGVLRQSIGMPGRC